jgi:hypothetical protein
LAPSRICQILNNISPSKLAINMLRSLRLSIFLTLAISCSARQISILGVWYFDRFGGPHGEIAESEDIVKTNQHDKGMMFTFTKDNKLIVTLPDGASNPNGTQDYRVLQNPRLIVIAGDTMQIMLLTSDILELYPKNESKAALFLKRSKEGKTSLSAP